jgi:hypothetical protein
MKTCKNIDRVNYAVVAVVGLVVLFTGSVLWALLYWVLCFGSFFLLAVVFGAIEHEPRNQGSATPGSHSEPPHPSVRVFAIATSVRMLLTLFFTGWLYALLSLQMR